MIFLNLFFSLSIQLSLTDIDSIPHPELNYNRQKAQNRDFYNRNFCVKFLLTNCVGCGIMEIPARATESGPPIIPHFLKFVNRQFVQNFWRAFLPPIGHDLGALKTTLYLTPSEKNTISLSGLVTSRLSQPAVSRAVFKVSIRNRLPVFSGLFLLEVSNL